MRGAIRQDGIGWTAQQKAPSLAAIQSLEAMKWVKQQSASAHPAARPKG
jgi:hypothetical protein